MQVKPDGIYGMFMEFLASKILPFDVRTTVTQFWRCMAQPHLKLREGHYSLIDGTEDIHSAISTTSSAKRRLVRSKTFY